MRLRASGKRTAIERIKGVEPLNYELQPDGFIPKGLVTRTREILVDGVKRSVVILGTSCVS